MKIGRSARAINDRMLDSGNVQPKVEDMEMCKISTIVDGGKDCDACGTRRATDQCMCPNCGMRSC